MEEIFFDVPLYSKFARLSIFSRLPTQSTILRFSETFRFTTYQLEKHKLAEQVLVAINELFTL